jgi:DNA excision repair protein ERCC-4
MSRLADDQVRIIGDDRERSAGVIEALGAMEDIQLSIGRLSLGNYVVENGLLVERKTVADLALSILDGRLFRQGGRFKQIVSGGEP